MISFALYVLIATILVSLFIKSICWLLIFSFGALLIICISTGSLTMTIYAACGLALANLIRKVF